MFSGGGEGIGNLGVATLDGVHVLVGRSIRGVTEPLFEVGETGARRGREGLTVCRKSWKEMSTPTLALARTKA